MCFWTFGEVIGVSMDSLTGRLLACATRGVCPHLSLSLHWWSCIICETNLTKLQCCDKIYITLCKQTKRHLFFTTISSKDKGISLQRRRERARSETKKTTDHNQSTLHVFTDHLYNVGVAVARPPHSLKVPRCVNTCKLHARTKQTARKNTGQQRDRDPKRSGSNHRCTCDTASVETAAVVTVFAANEPAPIK